MGVDTKDKYFELNLPSKLLPYKAFGVNKVECRYLKGKDEKIIAELTETNFERKFKVLLDGIIKGIDPAKLTIGDRLYLVIWLAINCYSDILPIETKCESCNQKIKLAIDLKKLEKAELTSEFKDPYSLTLTNGDIVNLKILRIEDQIKYLDYISSKDIDLDLMYKMALLMEDSRNMLERVEYLENLNTRDLSLIRAVHDKHIHGVKLQQDYICPKCGSAEVTPVPFRLDLLFPDGEIVARAINVRI